MAYTITNADGTTLVTIPDTQINTDYGVTLIGRNYSGYGTFLNDNFITLMENFNNPSAPGLPLEGQLWYNPNTYAISLWDSRAWKQIALSSASASAPSSAGRIVGDFWWDTANQQLNVWTGQIVANVLAAGTSTGSVVTLISTEQVRVGDQLTTTGGIPITTANNVVVTQILTNTTIQLNQAAIIASGQTVTFTRNSGWYVVGPNYTTAQQLTGIYPKTVVDTRGITHTVGLIYQHGQVLGAISKDNEYTLAPAYVIDRLPIIKPGITLLADAAPQTVRTVLSNSVIPYAGTTVINVSSTDGIANGDFVITGNITYSAGVTVSGVFPANASIAINANTIISTNELITFQRGIQESNMFYGTATNAQALNGITADRFATLATAQAFQSDVTVGGNIRLNTDAVIWDKTGSIYLDNLVSGGNWNVHSKISTPNPQFNKVVQGSVGPLDGYRTAIQLNSVNDLSTGDIIISANNQVGNLVTINSVFDSNSTVVINTADYFSASEPVIFQRGINGRLKSLFINGQYGNVEVARDPTSNMGVATKRYVDIGNNTSLQAVAANVAAIIGTASASRRDFGNVSNIIDQFYSNFTAVNAAVALRATIDSPAFTGTPTAPTPLAGDSDTSIATTKFVSDAGNVIMASTDASLTAANAQIALRATIDSPAFTGTPTAPSGIDFTDRTSKIATTYWVGTQLDAVNINTTANVINKAPLASPALSGRPTAPTAANLSYVIAPGFTYSLNLPVLGGDNTLATTGFVANAIATMPSANLVPYATKVNAALEGTPTAPTAAGGTATNQIATTSYVALYSPVLTVNGQSGNVVLRVADLTDAAPLASPALTGTPTTSEPVPGNSTTQIPTTSFVANIAANLAPINNPTLTGTVSIPTPAPGTNGAIATTCQWVNSLITNANTSVAQWGGATKFVSTAAPSDGQGKNGDIWFQYSP